MMAILVGLVCVLAMWAILCIGIVYAFCPVNDKDTTTTWRVVTLLITLVIEVVMLKVCPL